MDFSPAAAPCPKCETRGNLRYRWKPDLAPERERVNCYRCGWDTDWIVYGTVGARYRAPEREAVSPTIGTAA